MPAAIAVPLITAAVTAGTTVYASKRQGQSNDRAARVQEEANRQQLEQERLAMEADQRREEEAKLQWDADQAQKAMIDARREPYRARLGDLLGMGSNLGGGGGSSSSQPSGSSSSGPAPSIDPSKGDIAGQISAYFKSRGVADSETPYWVSKWSEFGAKDPNYFNQRLGAADIFGKSGGTTTSRPSSDGLNTPPPTYTTNRPAVGPNAVTPYAQTIPMSALLRRRSA